MLKINNLNKTYRNGVHALKAVNLDIAKGMFGLLGPNGAGKSSLIRTIATLQAPDSGTIHFNDINVLEDTEHLRRMLGYLPQEFGVYPGVTAQYLLNHFAILKGINQTGERKDAVEALLHQVNLYEQRDNHVANFSGGMKQRFGIAQALLGEPQLIIVDEPTAGLDPAERNRFHNLLAQVGEDVAVMLSTHIVEDVADLCSQMAVLANGQIILQGEPAKVIDNVRGKIWQKPIDRLQQSDYLARFNVLSAKLSGGKLVIHVLGDTCPEAGFVACDVGLEEVYFSTLFDHGISTLS